MPLAWSIIGALALAIAIAEPALADRLELPDGPLTRERPMTVTYRLAAPVTGTALLGIVWSDSFGRIVERRQVPLRLAGTSTISFDLDLRRAVAAENTLRARLVGAGDAAARSGPGADPDVSVSFVVPPIDRPWVDYHVIMWQPHDAAQDAGLYRLGIDAAAVIANRDDSAGNRLGGEPASLLRANLGWYVENAATDFYSAYHIWSPDHPVNWRFTEAKARYRADPDDLRAFFREPSLSDPGWLDRIRGRLTRIVTESAPYRPLFYSLGDETGIADLAAFWDFDMSPVSLAGMRRWLQDRYGSLTSLNREWGSAFATWEAVRPMTTREAMARTDENFAAWADFKAWMDIAFARALRAGTDAVHAADPQADAGIEGGQVPGWGGYDYSLLSHAVDLMELYDFGDNVDAALSFNPGLVLLSTSSTSGPAEEHRLWRALLRGGRGVILWDEGNQVVQPDGSPGPRGRAIAPLLGEFRKGIGSLLAASEAITDPVAILYSPASQRTQWMVDLRPWGEAWSFRDAEAEYGANPVRVSAHRFVRLFSHLGVQARFLSSAQIEAGALEARGIRVLVLPHALALSSLEATAIRRFVEAGGTLIADGRPGSYDEHSRRLDQPQLADLVTGPPPTDVQEIPVGRGRVLYLDSAQPQGSGRALDELLLGTLREWRHRLEVGGVSAAYPLARSDGSPVSDVETYLFRIGDVTIVALQRDLPENSGELSDPEPIVVRLGRAGMLGDLRRHETLALADHASITLDAVAPTVLAICPRPQAPPVVSVPDAARQGDLVPIRLTLDGAKGGVIRIEVIDPAGRLVPEYSETLALHGGSLSTRLPLALSDPPGRWAIRATDLATAQTGEAVLPVSAAPK